ncbi:MAG TPA: DUF1573 domain-containing protein [Candidatus Krumholzibacteria bacterium]|nr:DUF1573 domain-containing protein [Candidatus Krumholzibacteria bacterium]
MNKGIAASVLVAVLLVLAVAGGAQDSGPRPVAEISETTFDFGDVFEQELYQHVFIVRNRGKADLLIEDVKPG